jgi:uncharacterized membrane protein SpoIIM required for sporulation
MLPELILREERTSNLPLLAFFGLLSALIGISIARFVFPDNIGLVSVFLAALPLVYPLTQEFLEDEEIQREDGSPFSIYFGELSMYLSMFAGQVLGFFLYGLRMPEIFELQTNVFASQLSLMGVTGYASIPGSFLGILVNNLVVFGLILGVSALVGSAGAFILAWNGSVLGVFLSVLTREMGSSSGVPSPLLYVPHATLEMSGFIVAGIAGTTLSAAVYRRHFDLRTWRNLGVMVVSGVGLVLLGAIVETA